MASWEELEEKCREMGGELAPIPCSDYNFYCEDEPECVYHNEPIFEEYDDEGWLAYCCKPKARAAEG